MDAFWFVLLDSSLDQGLTHPGLLSSPKINLGDILKKSVKTVRVWRKRRCLGELRYICRLLQNNWAFKRLSLAWIGSCVSTSCRLAWVWYKFEGICLFEGCPSHLAYRRQWARAQRFRHITSVIIVLILFIDLRVVRRSPIEPEFVNN